MPLNSPDIANIISQRLGIVFLWDPGQEMEPIGNVCFAQSPEIRPEYKESFSLGDLIGYLNGLVYSQTKQEMYPTDANSFWTLVKTGNEHLLHSRKQYAQAAPAIEIQPVLKHNRVTRLNFHEKDKIWINDRQFLTGVPLQVRKLRLQGGCPANKWLENRLGKELDNIEMVQFLGLIKRLNLVCHLLKKI
ncbi:hypothetical protein K8352_08020 [Flavobacteriaceae bacterium F89]|uniref:Type ISP restriction-modification enzyme LLaBIII C-terminal specificity domain-containing protein n=1 Tax=Cerina litoralis TaxID=2874477 RepID=A0AAE3EUH1_9FLAO|nr:type ISP restriction/modification enzyme [Cerina litoralis]MCG2460690.1 hypothetical protein [Cerina litoralis]